MNLKTKKKDQISIQIKLRLNKSYEVGSETNR